jgi:hypothetical protein
MSFTASPTDFATMNNDNSNLPLFQLADIMGSNLPEALGAGRTLVWSATNDVWEDSAGSNQSFQFAAPRAYIDLNDDEILDIVSEQGYSICTPTCTNFTRLIGFQGLGNGAYASVGENLAGIENFGLMDLGPVTATDIDKDGLADLIVWDEDTIRVVRQTMSGTFTVVSNLLVTNHKFFRAALLVTDVTGDGYPEVIYAHYPDAVNALRIYVNDGTGNFGSTAVSSGVSEPSNFAAGDINGDGVQDLVVRNGLTNALDLYMSQGDGTFTLLSSIISVGSPDIKLTDIDLDGDMDIVTAGGLHQSTNVNVYLNQ